MMLSALIQKDGLAMIATATRATVATHETKIMRTVADVANVAVANAPEHLPLTLTVEEEIMIRSWLSSIGETDLEIIDHVLNQCRTDLDARDYFIQMAVTVLQPTPFNHNRQCAT